MDYLQPESMTEDGTYEQRRWTQDRPDGRITEELKLVIELISC